MPIRRESLRDQVKQEVLQLLIAGKIVPGTGVNEAALSKSLGVSRTPLREALITLQQEGVIVSDAGRGFRWTPISIKEFKELTPLLAAMEALAVQLTPPEHLRKITPELVAQADAFDANLEEHGVINRYDDKWHALLLSGCPNSRLMDFISSLKVALRRYERSLINDHMLIERAASEHRTIAKRLMANDIPGAVEALRANWQNGAERLLQCLDPNIQ